MKIEKKLTVKDIITVTLLTLVNVVIYMVVGMFCMTPLTLAIYPVVISLVQGIVFFVIGFKVQKPFAILIYTLVLGITGFNIPYILCYVLGGVISEILLKLMGYGKKGALVISYIVVQLLAVFGSTLYPYWIANATTYINNYGFDGNTDMLKLFTSSREFFNTGVSVGALIGTIVTAFIGALIGNYIIGKHLTNKGNRGNDYEELI